MGEPGVDPDLLEVARFTESASDWSWSWLSRDAVTATADVSIPASAFLLLRFIDQFQPISVSALARLVGLHPSTVSTQLRPLLDHGFVMADQDGDDRRVVSLAMTAAGRALCERVREAGARNWGMVLEDWSAVDLANLAELLRRVRGDVLIAIEAMREGRRGPLLDP